MNPNDIASALTGAFNFGGWVLANWLLIGQVVATLVAAYVAIREHQWNRLIVLAGKLAFDVATLTELDKKAKRDVVAAELYNLAGPVARKLFTQAQFSMAVEMGWKLIAKPSLPAGQGGA